MAAADYLTVPHLNRKQLARIFSKIAIDKQQSGCWTWTACRSKPGYGKSNIGSELVPSHRLVYAWLVEPLPRGNGRNVPCLDHLCKNRACCNPAHLELVTPRENLLRGDGACANNARKTHCKRGHELPLAPNIPKGRNCPICVKQASHDSYMRNREQVLIRTKAAGSARLNGPRREELLAQKRADYHAKKVLKRPQAASPSLP